MFASRAPDASLADARRSGTRARVGAAATRPATRVGRPPCACPKTIAFLRRFHRDQSSLTGEDAWEEHFRAEHDVLRPFLDRAAWARIEREHDAFRRSGYSDLVLMAAHAAFEDRLVEEILARAAEDGVDVGTGAGLGPIFLSGVAEAVRRASATTEKFIDPHFACWNGTPGGVEGHRGDGGYERAILSQAFRELYDMRGDQSVGLEYLGDVPNTAAARVAAMRQKVVDEARVKSPRYVSFRQASIDGLDGAIRLLAGAATDPSQRAALARSLGVPIDEANDVATRIRAWLKTSTGRVVEMIATDLGAPMLKLVREAMASAAGDASANVKSLVSSSKLASILGSIVQGGVDIYAEVQRARAESKQAACRQVVFGERQDATGEWTVVWPSITESVTRLADAGMMTPWHLQDVIGTTLSSMCDKAKSEVEVGTPLAVALTTARATEGYQIGMREQWKALGWDEPPYPPLPAYDQAVVRRWWQLALLLWSDPRVGDVMSVLGADYWGGQLASDEQVLLVAAPIAVSYGLDVDAFARRLWTQSKGWRSRPELLATRDGGGCGKIVDNARYVQFAVLAREAFALAEKDAAAKAESRDATSSSGTGTVVAIVATLLGAFLVLK